MRLNINRLGSNNTNKIIVIIALFSLLVIIAQTFFPFEQRQATSVQRQINNNNNTYLSLSMLSTATGTGAAATGILVNVPGVLKTRKQSKCLSCYLLEIHQKYDELKNLQTKSNIQTPWKVYVVILSIFYREET